MKKENSEMKLNNLRNTKKSSFAGNTNYLMEDLDKELKAADRFLDQNNDDVLKSSINLLITNTDNSNRKNPNDTYESDTSNSKIDTQLVKYQKQLKSFGFPQIGNFYFPLEEDKQKTFNFFDYIIMKKSSENEEKMKYKKHIELITNKLTSLQAENEKFQKELVTSSDEYKKSFKDKKDFESKINKSKEILEKQLSELKSNNTKSNNKYNVLLIEKKSLEEKYSKISETYQKIINKSCSPNIKGANSIDMIDNLKKNDIIKLLSKVKGTEKLIETFKNGFNESLRELLFEISALKNFIYELNCDLINSAKFYDNFENLKFNEIEYNLLNMPFLDTVTKIKYVFRNNLKIISQCIYSNNWDDQHIFDDEFLKDEKNEFDMTFDKIINDKDRDKDKDNDRNLSNITNKLVFDLEESNNFINGTTDRISKINKVIKHSEIMTEDNNQDEDYQNELEFLKNKWVKTLMSIKNKNEDDN